MERSAFGQPKSWKAFVLTVLVLFTLFLVGIIKPTYANEGDINSGVYDNVPWRITSGYDLLIGEEGKQFTFDAANKRYADNYPWYRQSKRIKNVIVLGTVKGAGDMSCMFTGFSSTMSFDLNGFDTSDVTGMRYMFSDCSAIESLDLTWFSTNDVIDMCSMFEGCKSLKSLDISRFDTSNVEDMSFLFHNCSAIRSLNITGFKTNNVLNMAYMFGGCSSLTSLNLNGFDTSKVNDMVAMFYDCKSLTAIDVSRFDTSNASRMEGMFSGCSSTKTIIVGDYWKYGNDMEYKPVFPDTFTYLEKRSGQLYEPFSEIPSTPSCTYVAVEHTHQLEVVPAINATCTTAGNKKYWKCYECGRFFADENGQTEIKQNSWIIEAKDHSYGDWKISKVATCTTAGKIEKRCYVCGYCISENITATGHEWNTKYTVDKKATYTESGSKSIHCSVCNAIKPGSQKTIAKLKKKTNTMTVKVKKKTVKAKKLKEKAQTVKLITVKKAKGKVSYKIVKANKKSKKALKINKKTGKITVNKKTKKGTYKLRVKVKAAGNYMYKAKSKTVNVIVKVK